MRILNLHGLGGSSENTNFRMIRQASPSSEIVSETIDYVNTSPRAIVEKYCNDGGFDIVVGNSFGGFFAYIIGTRLKIKTILTNPCVPPADYIPQLVEDYKYTDELVELWNKYQDKNDNCHIMLGTHDEVLDSNKTYWLLSSNKASFSWTLGGHSLSANDIDWWFEEKVSRWFEYANDGGITEQEFVLNGKTYSISRVFTDFENAINEHYRSGLADWAKKLLENHVWVCTGLIIDEIGIIREMDFTDNYGDKNHGKFEISIEDYFSDEAYRKEELHECCLALFEELIGWYSLGSIKL